MKIGVNLLLWTGYVTPEHFPIIEAVKKAGAEGVEIPIFEGEEKNYQSVGKEVKRQGLGLTAVTIATAATNPISPDPAVRKAALDHMKWAVDMAATAGVELLAGPFHSALGVFSGNPPTEEEKKRSAEVMYAMAEEASKVNVRIVCEYLNRFENYFLTTAADTAAFVKRVNHSNFQMMIDAFHAHIEEKDPAKLILDFAKQIVHFHVSENDRGTPGTGQVHWPAYFNALRQIDYKGWMVIEAFGRAIPELAAATRVWRDFFPSREQVYVDGIKFVRKMWDAAGK